MGLDDAVKAARTTALDEIEQSIADKFAAVSFGTPGAEDANKIDVELQLNDLQGNALAKATYLRLTCDGSATLSLASGGSGTVISGDDTNDMVIKTHTDGVFNLEVTDAVSESVSVAAGPYQGSCMLDCSEAAALDFTLV